MRHIWYLYIFTLLSLGIARTAERILRDSGGFASQYLPLVLTLIFSIGVYACTNSKPLFKRWFWKSFYWFSIVLSISLLGFVVYLGLAGGSNSLSWSAILILVFLFLIPAQVKIKEYSFKSPQIW